MLSARCAPSGDQVIKGPSSGQAGWLSERRRTTDGAAHTTEVDVNPTYEMCRAGSEHGVKRQRQSLTNQLSFLHSETQSHHATKSISLLGFHFGLEAVAQRSSSGPGLLDRELGHIDTRSGSPSSATGAVA
jgi:hypothetical protein